MSQRKLALNRTAAFARVMEQAHSHMNPAQKSFSKLLHVRHLDTVIEAIGLTIARPLPLLGGIIGMICSLALFYAIAKYTGYPLSGFEGFAGFLIGWTVGVIGAFSYILKKPRRG